MCTSLMLAAAVAGVCMQQSPGRSLIETLLVHALKAPYVKCENTLS